MRNELQLTRPTMLPAHAEDLWGGSTALASGGEPQPQPLRRIHRLMRGRYLVAGFLALLCGAAGGYAGWKSQVPMYRSDGVINIKPIIDSLDVAPVVVPMYRQYVLEQMARIHSQRVIEMAMTSQQWQQFKRGMSPKAKAEFFKELEVTMPYTDAGLIFVSFTDENPAAAQIAVREMIHAFQVVEEEEGGQPLNNKVATLTDDASRLRQQISAKENDIRQKLRDVQELGSEDLAAIYSRYRQQVIDLELMRAQAESALQIANSYAAADGKPSTTMPSLTDEQLARVDPRMMAMVSERDNLAAQIEAANDLYGPNHPSLTSLRTKYDRTCKNIKTYADGVRQWYPSTMRFDSGIAGSPTEPSPSMTIPMLTRRKQELDKQFEAIQAKAKTYGAAQEKIIQARADIEELKQKLTENQANLKHFQASLAQNGNVQILDPGSTPYVPVFDKRKQFAALGGLGGAMVPIGLFLLIGLFDKRYRYSDDTSSDFSGVTLLGILPNLPDLLTDPEQAAVAAHCVHQIRTMLQINGVEERRVFAVTSSSPEDGKTSLTLALGLSFAASGSRTLLIDCDLVGAGLTARLNVTSSEGVLEAIASHSVLEYVRPTEVADLSILPVGSAHAYHASTLSPAAVRRLVADAKKHFDVVLVDTGPILGSIEAPAVAAASDGVILTVSRGQQRPLVEKSLQHLLGIGAKLAGVVFNRAQARDFEQSVSRMSLHSVRRLNRGNGNANGHGKKEPAGEGAAAPSMGPVARAVATSSGKPNGSSDHS